MARLDIMSFDQLVHLNKAKIMYNLYNNLSLAYLQELFQMRDVNLDITVSKLRSVSRKNYILSQAKYNLFKGGLWFKLYFLCISHTYIYKYLSSNNSTSYDLYKWESEESR